MTDAVRVVLRRRIVGDFAVDADVGGTVACMLRCEPTSTAGTPGRHTRPGRLRHGRPGRTAAVAAIASAVVLGSTGVAACGGGNTVDDRLVAESGDDEFAPEGCGSIKGAADDLTAEPTDWLDEREYIRWEDTEGCPVRVDVVGHVHGDEACGWGSVELITIGDPPGTSYAGDPDPHRYYWDPDGAIGAAEPPTPVIERDKLPRTARDTGFRLDGTELWTDGADPEVIYRVEGEQVQVWALLGVDSGCS